MVQNYTIWYITSQQPSNMAAYPCTQTQIYHLCGM